MTGDDVFTFRCWLRGTSVVSYQEESPAEFNRYQDIRMSWENYKSSAQAFISKLKILTCSDDAESSGAMYSRRYLFSPLFPSHQLLTCIIWLKLSRQTVTTGLTAWHRSYTLIDIRCLPSPQFLYTDILAQWKNIILFDLFLRQNLTAAFFWLRDQ